MNKGPLAYPTSGSVAVVYPNCLPDRSSFKFQVSSRSLVAEVWAGLIDGLMPHGHASAESALYFAEMLCAGKMR